MIVCKTPGNAERNGRAWIRASCLHDVFPHTTQLLTTERFPNLMRLKFLQILRGVRCQLRRGQGLCAAWATSFRHAY